MCVMSREVTYLLVYNFLILKLHLRNDFRHVKTREAIEVKGKKRRHNQTHGIHGLSGSLEKKEKAKFGFQNAKRRVQAARTCASGAGSTGGCPSAGAGCTAAFAPHVFSFCVDSKKKVYAI